MAVGPYPSLSHFWRVSWRMYVSATQSIGGISRWNGWHSHDQTSSANQREVRTHRPTPRGVVRAEPAAGDLLVVADLDGRPEAEVEAHKNG